MSVKDYYSTVNGGALPDFQPAKQPKKKKSTDFDLDTLIGVKPTEEAETISEEPISPVFLPKKSEEKPLALWGNSGYNPDRGFYRPEDVVRDLQNSINSRKEFERSLARKDEDYHSAPKATDSLKTIMKKTEYAESSPELQEFMGNVNPSKSPEAVASEDWRGNRVRDDIPKNSTPRLRPERQYKINMDWDISAATDQGGHINGQDTAAITDMPYGSSTVGHAGCESIAVYNLLRDMGIDASFPEVIRTADEINSFFKDGQWGILPGGTKRLLQEYNIDYENVNKNVVQAWDEHGYMFDGERYIAIMWNQGQKDGKPTVPDVTKGIHTFLMVYDEQGQEIGDTGEIGHWIVYNRYSNVKEASVFKDLNSVLGDNGRYWEILKINGVKE